MEISEIRRYNLWVTAHPFGYSDQGVKTLAENTGKSVERIRHLIGKSPYMKTAKNIGTASAREFEDLLGMPNGWMDTSHEEEWGRHGISCNPSDVEALEYQPRERKYFNNLNAVRERPVSPLAGRVPIVSWVQAGEFCEASDIYPLGVADDWAARPPGASDKTFALRVQGDSMTSPYPAQRSYPEGTVIYVDPAKEVLPGNRGVFRLPDSNEVTFKELVADAGEQYLKPINPQYDKIKVTPAMTCCGRVIGSFMPE